MAKKVNIEITNPVGLYDEKSVNMKSLMGVLSLGIPHKAKIEIVVEGEDEGTAMDMIVEKIKSLEIGTIQ